jgi:signal peptidase
MARTTLTAIAAHRLSPPNPLAALARSEVARRAFKLVSYCALACLLGVLGLVATATLPVLFGYHTYSVDGGSMEPALKRGSVAIAASTSPSALRVGDIIAYRQSPQNPPVLHRIVQITTSEDGLLGFITQGDQNQTPDAQPVPLHGPGDKVMYTVPYAGYILDFARSTFGRILLVGLPLPVLLAMFLLPRKRTAGSATASSTASEPNSLFAESTPTWATEGPSFRTQALQRDLFSPTMQPVTAEGALRPSFEAQASQRGLFSPTIRPVGRAPRPSLQAQAFQLGLLSAKTRPVALRRAARPRWRRRPSTLLLRATTRAVAEAGPAPQRRAA